MGIFQIKELSYLLVYHHNIVIVFKMNIFELSERNSKNLKNQYKTLVARKEPDIVWKYSQFSAYFNKNWTISFNLKPSDLTRFLIDSNYKNAKQVLTAYKNDLEELGYRDAPLKKALEKRLRDFYKKRKKFEDAFDGGKDFEYGAVNIGGCGPTKYGPFCVVLKKQKIGKYSTLAFVKKDSLSYFDTKNNLDLERLGRDLANRKCIHYLAILKHKLYIHKLRSRDWCSHICCNKRYIEAITKDRISNKDIMSITISEKEFRRYINLLHNNYNSELSETEKQTFEILNNTINLIKKEGLKLEVP